MILVMSKWLTYVGFISLVVSSLVPDTLGLVLGILGAILPVYSLVICWTYVGWKKLEEETDT